MTRDDMVTIISKKLQKQEHMYKGYVKGSICLKMLCDNLAIRLLKEIEEEGVLPPPKECPSCVNDELGLLMAELCEWEEL